MQRPTFNLSGAAGVRLKDGLGLNTHALSEKPERATELISAITPTKHRAFKKPKNTEFSNNYLAINKTFQQSPTYDLSGAAGVRLKDGLGLNTNALSEKPENA